MSKEQNTLDIDKPTNLYALLGEAVFNHGLLSEKLVELERDIHELTDKIKRSL